MIFSAKSPALQISKTEGDLCERVEGKIPDFL